MYYDACSFAHFVQDWLCEVFFSVLILGVFSISVKNVIGI
jgi:hypothetical protein